MKILLIDDRRFLEGARIARNFADGIAALQEEKFDILYLDHDLGDFSGPEGRELTGYTVACWLEANPEHLPDKLLLVSDNTVGQGRIRLALEKYYGRIERVRIATLEENDDEPAAS